MPVLQALTNSTLAEIRKLGGFSWNYNFKVSSITDTSTNTNLVSGQLLPLAAAKLPGIKLNAAKVPYGAFEINVPMNTSFPENTQWAVSLFSDKNGVLRNIFKKWQEDLYNYPTQTGRSDFRYNITLELGTEELDARAQSTTTPNIKSLWDRVNSAAKTDPIAQQIKNALAGWQNSANLTKIIQNLDRLKNKGNYTAEIDSIRQPFGSGSLNWTTTQTYTLYGCFPVMLDGIQYSAENPEVIKFSAVLAYQYFEKK